MIMGILEKDSIQEINVKEIYGENKSIKLQDLFKNENHINMYYFA